MVGQATGFWSNTYELKANWTGSRAGSQNGSTSSGRTGYAGWKKAVERTLNWVEVG